MDDAHLRAIGLGLVVLGSGGCASNHRVSPWGAGPTPSVYVWATQAELGDSLAQIDTETRALGLTMTTEIKAELPSGNARSAVLRGYEGHDATGLRVFAIRVATSCGVVLARGPLEATDADRRPGVELLPELATTDAALSLRSGTDLTGSGGLDLIARNEAGVLSILRVGACGASEYPVTMAAPPRSITLLPDDPRPVLMGRIPIPAGDPLAPELVDVASFADGRFSNKTDVARAYHEHAARASDKSKESKTISSRPENDSVATVRRLRVVLERAFHQALAQPEAPDPFADARKTAVPSTLATSFDRHLKVIEAATRR